MSYANVTAHNAPPLSQQPHPDLGLLNTSNPSDESLPDVDTAHVTVVAHDFGEKPKTITSETKQITVEHSDDEDEGNVPGSVKRQARKEKARVTHTHPTHSHTHPSSTPSSQRREERVRRAERKIEGWVDYTKRIVLRPEVAGGFFAVVNLGVLGYTGYQIYQRPTLVTKPQVNWRPLSIIGGGIFTLFALEGFAADQYLETPQGQRELQRAEDEGHYLYNRTHEVVIRPGVFSGLLGFANVAVLGGLGYITYTHWDTPAIDRRNISIATVGLITWFSGQGFLVERYRQKHNDQWEAGKKDINRGVKKSEASLDHAKRDVEKEFGKLGEDLHSKTFSERLQAERIRKQVESLEKSKAH